MLALKIKVVAAIVLSLISSNRAEEMDFRNDNHTTYLDARGNPRATYVAELVIADFGKCDQDLTQEEFYSTIIANFGSYVFGSGSLCYGGFGTHKVNQNSLSVKLVGSKKLRRVVNTMYNSKGNTQRYGKWMALSLNNDVRDIDPVNYVIEVNAGMGIGDLYIPVLHALDSELVAGHHYMIHIAPDYGIWNDKIRFPDSNGAVQLWNSGGCKEDYSIGSPGRIHQLNVTKILLSLDEQMSPEIREAFTSSYVRTAAYYNTDADRDIRLKQSNSYPKEQICEFETVPPPAWKNVLNNIVNAWGYFKPAIGVSKLAINFEKMVNSPPKPIK